MFVAIATDSGWFRFSNADARIYRNAAELIEAGASPVMIYQKLYQNFAQTRLKLTARMLDSLERELRESHQKILRENELRLEIEKRHAKELAAHVVELEVTRARERNTAPPRQ